MQSELTRDLTTTAAVTGLAREARYFDAREHRIDAARLPTRLLFLTSALFCIVTLLTLLVVRPLPPTAWTPPYLILVAMLVASLAGAAAQASNARSAEHVSVAAIAGVGFGLLALSLLWMPQMPFSSYFLVMFVFSALALTGVRPQRLLPLALLLLALDAGLAYLLNGWTAAAHLSLLGDATAALVGSATALQLGQLYRHDWLRTRESLEDPLTGLHNRRAFQRCGEQALAQARREQRPVTLALIDVDDFKQVNDRHGHAAGDAALRSIGDSLRAFARRPLDCVVRLGGDEFAVLWFDLDATEAHKHCKSLVAQIATKPLALAGGRIDHPRISLGAYTAPAGAVDLTELQRRADAALYQAKREGGNAARLVAPSSARLRAGERSAWRVRAVR